MNWEQMKMLATTFGEDEEYGGADEFSKKTKN